MMDLIYGPRGTDQRAPVEEIRKTYADALLALTADSIEAALIDPTGTVRRLRALVAIGWQETALAEALGMGVGNFWTLLHGRRNRITTGTRNKVTALFIQQWDKPQDGYAPSAPRRSPSTTGGSARSPGTTSTTPPRCRRSGEGA
jgi:hypothetical protein